jgi:cell shape-determining protein MreD
MDFPTIKMNIWDAIFAIPIIIIFTQFIKIYFKTPKWFVPTIALMFGLGISIFISHKHNLIAGIFMGWFYGYAAVGTYASLKTNILALRKKAK